MNVFNPAIFAAGAPCMPCCSTPSECACALLIPPFQSPYADYATALAVIDGSDVDERATCYAYATAGDPDGEVVALTADASVADELSIALQISTDIAEIGGSVAWASVTIEAGCTLTVAYDLSGTGAGYSAEVDVYDCFGNFIDADVDTAGTNPLTGTFTFPITDAGTYYIQCIGFVGVTGSPTLSDLNWVISSDSSLVVNPVIALWDDSGTTRQLEACPKMLLPPLTESSGIWYTDETEAQDAIDDLTSNCVGYYENTVPDSTGFTATDGGAVLTLEETFSVPVGGSDYMWGSVNAEAGATLSDNWSGGPRANMLIYDNEGMAVETIGDASSPLVSAALPYTGKYIVAVRSITVPGPPPSPFTTATHVISSSGTMTINPIQALWDNGLTCPARLDC